MFGLSINSPLDSPPAVPTGVKRVHVRRIWIDTCSLRDRLRDAALAQPKIVLTGPATRH